MGTKNNPGEYDCYAQADPDEPMFVLLARDRLAPALVRMWADRRSGGDGNESNKTHEARTCARAMEEWDGDRKVGQELYYVQRTGYGVYGQTFWWAVADAGYVESLDGAKVWTHDELEAHGMFNPDKVIWPKAYVDSITQRYVPAAFLNSDKAVAAADDEGTPFGQAPMSDHPEANA